MKSFLLLAGLLLSAAAQAQTVPLDPSAPVRGGSQGQTNIPPVNPALNQSTIQGPPEIQRTPTNRDAQMSRPLDNTSGTIIPAGTPELSPTAVPDVREQPIMRDNRPRQSTDVVPSRSRRSNSSTVPRP
ncbi:hypothetical protein [Hymenobacter properus]|uniref:Uncharacterized protein n=1 Tax=Hymenobacter properus TaxID=2791026 RepID=A0A931FPK8_9BACT|nr:hypothetical protein [Hymenobacter properus]MBF9143714.1 hypothetical protein [Hymenobacter properus]MBR7722527.1 hypothetical protein [Microvirga sp. SRT04]